MGKIKLLFFGIKYFPSRGGTSRVAENLIRQMKDEFDITIFCYKNRLSQQYIDGVKVIEFYPIFKGSIGAFFYFLRSAFYLLLFCKPDIIHVHKIDACLFIPWFYKKAKVIATSHESPYMRDKWSLLEKKFFKFSEQIYIRSSATLTSISKPLTETYESEYGRKVKYIPNGISISPAYNDKKAKNFLSRLNLNPGNYIFFAARRIMKTKGLHTLLKALSQLNYQGNVLVAGDLEHASGYIKELKTKYAHLHVIYPGYIGELPLLLSLIKQSRLFVFPSETEGMSIMLLEAATTLTPIICSDIKENKEIFNDNHVTYFRNKDAADLAHKILSAHNNNKTLNLKAENALNHIENHYSWDKIAKEYVNLYASLMKN